MAPEAYPHVLLETVALAAHEDSKSAGFGREPEGGDPARREQQELLADGPHPCDATGAVQRLAAGARPAQHQSPVVQGPGLHGLKSFVARADWLNRPLRTHTVGGVGAGG